MEDGTRLDRLSGGLRESAAAFRHAPLSGRGEPLRPVRSDPVGRAKEAAFALREHRPDASAGRPFLPALPLLAGPGLYLSGCLLFAPRTTVLLLMLAAGLCVGFALTLRLAGVLCAVRHSPRRPLGNADLPSISLLLALHREAPVIPGLVRALQGLDYPRDRLEILFAIECDDHETLTAARAAARHHPVRVLAVPAIGPRTKPKALNYALGEARGELVAVYDAEDSPHPGQLRAAAEAFAADARLACVQAPLGWYNREDNWLTRQFALEYALQFHGIVPLIARMGWPVPLGGTSNVFRRDALERAGAWDPFNVTEDADLGFRLIREGWRIGTIAPGTLEEAPVRLGAWTAQRSRWLKGHLVSWLVQMRDPAGLCRAGGPGALVCLQLTLAWNILSAVLNAPALLACALLAGVSVLAGEGAGAGWITLPFAAYGVSMFCALRAGRRAGLQVHPGDLLTLPVYWLFQAPAALRALRELAGRPYFWAKTTHGVSVTRREAPR